MELLAELPDVASAVSYPLRCTQRIKYTCFDVSKNLLVFGATSGGLYVFNREPCTFIQLIPNKEGSIIKIRISPDEKCVAFATHKGYVCVCDCGKNIGSYIKSPILQISKEHQGNEVTYIIWNKHGNELYIGDDVGAVSVLYILKSFAKNVFQTPTVTLMELDSRIVQIDTHANLILVSTLTKSFICDVFKEHYAQIGHKLRDGEYGACFYYEHAKSHENGNSNKQNGSNKFSIVPDDQRIDLEDMDYLRVYCARPGSRIWEVGMNGTVICTHQFKEPLSVPPSFIFTNDLIENDSADFDIQSTEGCNQSLNFPALYLLKNKYLFAYRKDGIYIFDPRTPAVVLWSDKYKDIVDCKILNDCIYMWRSNGNLTILSYHTIETFLVKSFLDQKYRFCAYVCSRYSEIILNNLSVFKKIHILSELRDKLKDNNDNDLLHDVEPILDEICKIEKNVGSKSKSGIYVVENSFTIKSAPDVIGDDKPLDSALFQITPVIKEIGNTMSDKLNLEKLKRTWDHLELRMKNLKLDKMYNDPLDVGEHIKIDSNENIELDLDITECDASEPSSSHDSEPESVEIKELRPEEIYELINSSKDYHEDILALLTNSNCDIKNIFQVIIQLENYMISNGASDDLSFDKCSRIFLEFINRNLNESIDRILDDDDICSYFLRAFFNINSNVKTSNCECGFPLPSITQQPEYSELIGVFIEKKWESREFELCYDICKKVPYMWKKMILLRKDEDLKNLLLFILQILDEDLLYTYLPQFTVETWKVAVQLLPTLKKQECLNCRKRFDCDDVIAFRKAFLDWDTIGELMLKSIGPLNSVSILKDLDIVNKNDLTLKFYHACMFVKMFTKYDPTVTNKLIETIYKGYLFDDAVNEMSEYLKVCLLSELRHTALPFSIASKSGNWGLNIKTEMFDKGCDDPLLSMNKYRVGMDFEESLKFLDTICPNTNCLHCCFLLSSRPLINGGGLWVFSCGHTFHGVCLNVLKVKLCPQCHI